VWSLGVVFVSPRSRECPGIPDAIEDLNRQELISQAAVEALGVAALPRAARLDGHGIDTYLPKPPTECVGNELRIVGWATNCFSRRFSSSRCFSLLAS